KEQLAAQLAEHAVKIDKLTIEKEALTAQIEPLKAKLDQSLVIEQGLLEKQQELPILREEKEQLTAQLTEHAVKIEELTIEKGALTAQIEPLKVQIAELNADREALDQLEHRLEQEQVLIHQLNNKAENLESTNQTIKRQMGRMVNTLQSELESKHLTIKSYRQQLKITLLNSLLYPSSSSRLSIQGKTALQKLAPLLKESAPHAIHVAGHTDNRPFRSNAISPYNNNWDLSSARASEVVRFLISQGVNNSRFTTLGYADTNPKGDNNTEEGRAQNRRIELFIKGRSEG
ncbi:MAG: OmpA family protein, partial [Sedimenticola sp.]